MKPVFSLLLPLSLSLVLSLSVSLAAEKKLPLPGETFAVAGRPAILIAAPAGTTPTAPRPWVWYAPTLEKYPGKEEVWLISQLLTAGISIAGIDVGESFGNPAGRALFTALHTELTRARGYSAKPLLLGRSRGGLMLLAWAAENPEKVGAFAGIYPVVNLTSYPGLDQAAPVYALTAAELAAQLTAHNPDDRLASLAAARIPLFAIHGDRDTLVPLDANSALLKSRYTALGGDMKLIIAEGQGHNLWPGFFENPALLAFLIAHARP